MLLTGTRPASKNGAVPSRAARLLLAAAVVSAATAVAPARAAPVAERLAAALSVSGVDPARTGVFCVDLRSGRTVFAHNSRRPLVPASNEKLVVAFAALAALGPSFRMRTEVLGEGRLVDRRLWRGNLVLRGYGDPTLTRAGLAQLAAQVRTIGIRRVSGNVVADESWFDRRRTGRGWRPWFFLEEAPALSALVADRGRFEDRMTVRPALAAASLFRRELVRAGIAVRGRAKIVRAGGVPLASLFSPPLAQILRSMGTDSDNFTAEMVLKAMGATLAGAGSASAGASVARRVLAARGVPLRGVRLADGSGLSSADRLTARALVAVLEAAWRDAELRPFFVESLALSGRTGTLEDRLRSPSVRGRVRAKTGTTSLASALSGYVGDRYAFAILQNGDPVATASTRAAQDRFVAVLAGL
jgi:D-alanyl-D-alanine carboxypeptidase/D-alanyl-D-alanine-endopeptidase (penicillin-binding protein 4)